MKKIQQIKPMKAAKFKHGIVDYDQIPLPCYASPKFDGVRAMVRNSVVVSKSMKPIPNKKVQRLFGKPALNGFDSELIVGSPTDKMVFQNTMSGVMSVEGGPDVRLFVFDSFAEPEVGFRTRKNYIDARVTKLHREDVVLVEHELITDSTQLIKYEGSCIHIGYEGIMTRHPDGLYKYGRSTMREALLIAVKQFVDGEAMIIGYTELMHNSNEAKVTEDGSKKRSTKKDGMMMSGMLGSWLCRDVKTKIEFEIGVFRGFTITDRVMWWDNRDRIVKARTLIKYSSQPSGVKEKPRFPVMLGFRSKLDM